MLKYQQNRSGVRFATRFLVGRGRDFLFMSDLSKKLAINKAPIITVTGKAYFDIGHAPEE